MSDYYNQLDSTRYSEADIYGEDYMKVTRYMDSNGVFLGNVYTDKLVVGEAKITSALIESIEADQINANELSAISANLGTITAGHITGVTMDLADGNFVVDKNGNVTFSGKLSGASGTFSGFVELSKMVHDDILGQMSYRRTYVTDEGVIVEADTSSFGGLSKLVRTELKGSSILFDYRDDLIPQAICEMFLSGNTFCINYDGYGSVGNVSIGNANLSVNGRVDASDSMSTKGNFSVSGRTYAYGNVYTYGTLRVDTLSGLTNTEVVNLGGTSNYININTSYIGFYSDGSLVGRFAVIGNGYSLIMATSMMKSLTSSSIIEFRNSSDSAYIPLRASAFNTSSKREYKENIKEYDANALDIVANTKVYTYNFKEDENKVKRIGLIVDEAPSDVVYDEESIDTYAMISVLWKAVQELYNTIKEGR